MVKNEAKFKNLSDEDFNKTAWRYLTVRKFMSLLTERALWFSKLAILEDRYEGIIPPRVEAKMVKQDQKWKEIFKDPEHQRQIDEFPKRNMEDSRELVIVSCWFLDEDESPFMWQQYAGEYGVAIKTTVRKLATHISCDINTSKMGKIKYVNLDSHMMSIYEAHQGLERAFIKGHKYSHEQELRIACLNLRKSNLRSVDLQNLLSSIIIAPNTFKGLEMFVKNMVGSSNLNIPVLRSNLDKIQDM